MVGAPKRLPRPAVPLPAPLPPWGSRRTVRVKPAHKKRG